MGTSDSGAHAARRAAAGRSIFAGVLMGVGVAAFIDETVFHQLLHWHHFYDKSTLTWDWCPTVSSTPVGGWRWLSACFCSPTCNAGKLRSRNDSGPGLCWAGGGFQVYDGLFQHKVLGLHQIRY